MIIGKETELIYRQRIDCTFFPGCSGGRPASADCCNQYV